MLFLTTSVDAGLTTAGSLEDAAHHWPAPRLMRGAAEPVLDEVPGFAGTLRPVVWLSGLCAGWVQRGATHGTQPRVHVIDSQTPGRPRLAVLLDGYVTRGLSSASPQHHPGTTTHAPSARDDQPRQIAELYRHGGPEALTRLDGSFIIVVLDIPDHAQHVRDATVIVQTDPAGARPIYWAAAGDDLVVAPAPKCFARLEHLRGQVEPAAVLSIALNSYIFDELTYWQGVRLLGPARQLLLRNNTRTLTRYWAPTFDHASAKPVTIDEYADTLATSVRDHVQFFQRPAVGLSGGVDSRVLLAGARLAGRRVGLVTWTYDHQDRPDGDFAVACALGQTLGTDHRLGEHLRWPLDNDKLAEQAERIVYINDGLIGYLGAYGDREPLARELASQFDCILLGDQCYRGEAETKTRRHAVRDIGVQPLTWPVRQFVRFLFQPNDARQMIEAYQSSVADMIMSADPDKHPHPQDLHDRLYWQVRVPRLLTGPKSLYRLYLDAVSPMLSKPLIELGARLTIEQRVNKAFLREATRKLAPDLMAVPYAKTHSRVRWKKVFAQDGPLQRRLVEMLLDGPADPWLSANVKALARQRLAAAGDRAGDGMRQALLARAFAPFAKPPLFLNLITLRLWARQFG